MAGATAASTAAVTASHAAIVQISLIGNSFSYHDNSLNGDLTGGKTIVDFRDLASSFLSTDYGGGARVSALVGSVFIRAAIGFGIITTASGQYEDVSSTSLTLGQKTARGSGVTAASLIPITFTDPRYNGGARTDALLEVDGGEGAYLALTRLVFDNADAKASLSTVVAGGTNTVIGTTEQGFYARVKNDFTGDGSPDLIFQNIATGEVMAWLLNGTTYQSTKAIGNVGKSAWQIVGTGVFSGNGQNDLLWQNSVTGEIVIWLLNGTKHISTHSVGKVADTAWKIVGTGVFSGSGKPDLVFQNTKTGQVEIWLMNGATHVSTWPVSTEADTDWKIVATGDIDGDGNTDLIFQNSSTGQIMVWYMNGTNYESSATLETIPGAGWNVVGAGDFNRDGNTDLVLQNSTTGKIEIWLMNGGTYVSTVHTGTESDTNYQIRNR